MSMDDLLDYPTYFYPKSQLKDYIYRRSRSFFARGESNRDILRTPQEVSHRQTALREYLLHCLGGLPAESAPLNAKVAGVVQGNGFSVEKVIFESRPRHYVTANLYLPKQRPPQTSAVLFLCGHFEEAKHHPEYQMVCQMLTHSGLIVLAVDPIGQGERWGYPQTGDASSIKPCCAEHDHVGAQCRLVGDGLARYFLHDAMRAVDYLAARPEVDASRIGVTGNSGGGMQTSLLMMVDPRVAAAAPATFITNREAYQLSGQAQDAEQIWPGFSAEGYDHEDILLAMAPRPVCVLAVRSDFFPIEATRRTVERSRRIWEIFEQSDALELVEDESRHAYTKPLAKAAARFFAKHLLMKEVNPDTFDLQSFDPRELHCTHRGQVRDEFADAEFVFEANTSRLSDLQANRKKLSPEEQESQAITWLRHRVFDGRESVPLNIRFMANSQQVDGFHLDIVSWWSQAHLNNLGMLFRSSQLATDTPVTIALWEGGTNSLSEHQHWISEESRQGRVVFVLNLCGMGPLSPDSINYYPPLEFYGTFHKLFDDLDWIGDSLVALRTYELLRSLDVLKFWSELTANSIRFYGHGRMGLHGWLAAKLDPRITHCDWKEKLSFANIVRNRYYHSKDIKSCTLPGILRYFDL